MQSIPTDNLYKFIAISGLVLAFFSFYLPQEQIRSIRLEIIDIESTRRLINEQNKLLNRRKSIESQLDSESSVNIDNIYSQREKLFIEQVKLTGRLDRITYLTHEYKKLKWFSYFGTVVGVLLSIVGFTLWYYRVQRHMDKAIEENNNET